MNRYAKPEDLIKESLEADLLPLTVEPAERAKEAGVDDVFADKRFTLVGSQAMGTSDDESDWDFAIQDGPEVRMLLSSYGFIEKPKGAYDGNTVAIFERGNAEVAIVRSLERKLRIMKVLRENTHLRDLDLELRHRRGRRWQLWKALYDLGGPCDA